MQTSIGQLTFCTNIFPGESWEEHFEALKKYVPAIKKELSPDSAFGIGLRLSNKASLQLSKEEALNEFRQWLAQQDCYVFTMNGFPYGNFHRTRVKDQVHAPDWTTNERLQYTLRLFRLLSILLPEEMDGGVSTSPLSYRHWFSTDETLEATMDEGTWHILQVVEQLHRIHQTTGKMLHLDLEPEPDGMIESGNEFISWYTGRLLPLGISFLEDRLSCTAGEAERIIKAHLRLCYDVCHFAMGYEEMTTTLDQLQKAGIQIGKWQLSSALKILLPYEMAERQAVIQALSAFDEPVYLHQVVARQQDGVLLRYPDLAPAIHDKEALRANEWRSHFHVPLFVKTYGSLGSTQQDVIRAIQTQTLKPVTHHLEVETYTWDILPHDLKVPLDESVIREMKWVMDQIKR